MSVHYSYPGNAHHHFEQIAQILLAKKNAGDVSSCDLQMKLKNGEKEHLHSTIAIAHSEYLNKFQSSHRAPFSSIDMRKFEPESVKRVVGWMYTGEIKTPLNAIGADLAVAEHLRMKGLRLQLSAKIRKMDGSAIQALNVATERSVTTTTEPSFRPWLTMLHESEMSIQELVNRIANSTEPLTPDEISELNVGSVVALMAAPMPIRLKMRLINVAISWILMMKPSEPTINAILQSIMVTDITFETLYSIRYTLKQFLSSPNHAGKTRLSLSPNGTISLQIDIETNATRDVQLSMRFRKKSRSNSAPRVQCPPPVHRTRSELSDIQNLPDPFGEDLAPAEQPEQRETTDGFPKYFTKSEVEHLQKMTDPFEKSEKEEAAPGWNPKLAVQYSESTINDIQKLPDPFVDREPAMLQGPVIMSPTTTLSNYFSRPKQANSARNSFSGHCQAAPLRDPLVTCGSSESLKSANEPGKTCGIWKTESEIEEINALPKISQSRSRSTSRKNRKVFQKSHYLFPH